MHERKHVLKMVLELIPYPTVGVHLWLHYPMRYNKDNVFVWGIDYDISYWIKEEVSNTIYVVDSSYLDRRVLKP